MTKKEKVIENKSNLKKESIGHRIARFRKARGYTQVELAKKMDVAQGLISHYESGRLRLHDEIIIQFAQTLGVNSDEILGLKSTENTTDKPNLKLIRRLKKIEALPKFKQRIILETLDHFLKGAGV